MKKMLLLIGGLLLMTACATADQAVGFTEVPTCTQGGCEIIAVHNHMW